MVAGDSDKDVASVILSWTAHHSFCSFFSVGLPHTARHRSPEQQHTDWTLLSRSLVIHLFQCLKVAAVLKPATKRLVNMENKLDVLLQREQCCYATTTKQDAVETGSLSCMNDRSSPGAAVSALSMLTSQKCATKDDFRENATTTSFAGQAKLTRQRQRGEFAQGRVASQARNSAAEQRICARGQAPEIRAGRQARQACAKAFRANIRVTVPATDNEGATLAKLCNRGPQREASSICWRTWQPSLTMRALERATDNQGVQHTISAARALQFYTNSVKLQRA